MEQFFVCVGVLTTSVVCGLLVGTWLGYITFSVCEIVSDWRKERKESKE